MSDWAGLASLEDGTMTDEMKPPTGACRRVEKPSGSFIRQQGAAHEEALELYCTDSVHGESDNEPFLAHTSSRVLERHLELVQGLVAGD